MTNYNSPIKIDVFLLDKQLHVTWYKIGRAYLVKKPLQVAAVSEDITHGRKIVEKFANLAEKREFESNCEILRTIFKVIPNLRGCSLKKFLVSTLLL